MASPPSNTLRLVPSSPDDFERAFDVLVHEHYEKLCNFAYRYLGAREAAEDAVHDVLLNVWKRRELLDAASVRGYLYRSVYHQCGSMLRQRRIRGEMGLEFAADVALPGTAELDAEGREFLSAVARAVDALPERCRLIYTMHREQELSYKEIAEVLDISVKTVETQMGRALKALRTALGSFLSIALFVGASWWGRGGT